MPYRFSCVWSCRAAFSLVEMSVVIVIISIVATFGLEGAAQFMDRTAYRTTIERIDAIDRAIADFRRVNGYLPCPALQSLTPTTACYGKQVTALGPPVACASTGSTCVATAMITSNPTSLVYGDVPVRDLGLPLNYMVDGYGSKFRYVATKDMTTSASYVTTADGIAMRSGRLDDTCSGSSKRCQSLGTAAYIVTSGGRDRRGTMVAASASLYSACVANADNDGKIDAANCRMSATNWPSTAVALAYGSTVTPAAAGTSVSVPNNVFYDSRFNAGKIEDNYFDDIVRWRSKSVL